GIGDARGPVGTEGWALAHSAASRQKSSSPLGGDPGHGERVSRGYQAAGSSPTEARSSSSLRTLDSRPDSTVNRSGIPPRSSRTTTERLACRTRKQWLCAGRL